MARWTEQDIKNLQRNPRKKRRQKAPPKLRQNANHLAKAITHYLSLRSSVRLAWRQNNGGIWDRKANAYRKGSVGMPGLSDVIGIGRNGKWLAVEIKVNGDLATDQQIRFIEQVNAGGGIGIIATDFDSFKQEFDKMENRLI